MELLIESLELRGTRRAGENRIGGGSLLYTPGRHYTYPTGGAGFYRDEESGPQRN